MFGGDPLLVERSEILNRQPTSNKNNFLLELILTEKMNYQTENQPNFVCFMQTEYITHYMAGAGRGGSQACRLLGPLTAPTAACPSVRAPRVTKAGVFSGCTP